MLTSFVLGRYWEVFRAIPRQYWLTTGDFRDNLVRFPDINHLATFESVKLFFLNWFLLATKRFFPGLPWPWALVLVTLAGWRSA